MRSASRLEQALADALASGESAGGPPRLVAAVRHAVFPGGARVRPKLCLAVAQACGDDEPAIADAAAAAVELLHCASLVHDDLPCFDDSPLRRGRESVHRAFGEPLAVLAGDALIVLAFQSLVAGAARRPERLVQLVATIAQGVGLPSGIVAGQAWECEPRVVLADYQRAKTGALFAAATMAGAQAAGAPAAPWASLGQALGDAYQAADDIRDVIGDPDEIGKPVGQDLALLRPSMARELGLEGAIEHFERLVDAAVQSVPVCAGIDRLRALVRAEAERLVPAAMAGRSLRVTA